MGQEFIVSYVSEDKMNVSVAIRQPEGEEAFQFSVDLLKDYLKEKGIKVGINEDALEALTSCVEYNREIVVVSGKPVVNGVDGHFEYLVPMEDKKAKPVVAEDGSVDYMNSLSIAMVEEGDVFAKYIPPTKGEFGYNVFYEMIAPVPGKPAKPLRGKGFTISEDGMEYIAGRAGRIYMDNDKIVIDPCYVVSGDLDVHHGNIKFNGDVEIRGDMHSGTLIEAEGSIFINGHVGSCVLRAGGNITIGKGVQGKYECEITAGGDVAGSFMEYCSIRAGGNIYANSMLDCQALARKSIYVTSKHGCIIGGNVAAMQEIVAKGLGNETEIITRLMIGEHPELREEIEKDKQRMEKIDEDIRNLAQKLMDYEKTALTKARPELDGLKRQVARAKILLQTEFKELKAKVEAYETDLNHARATACVNVSGIVYRGVNIRTLNASYTQEEACKEVIFKARLTEIVPMSPEEYKVATTA